MPTRVRIFNLVFGPLLCTALSSTARAQRAEYVSESSLPGEGLSHLVDASMLAGYGRVLDAEKAGGLESIALFSVHNRVLIGPSASYCTGLDGDIGASNDGIVYAATAFPVGAGVRWGEGNYFALCGGAGLSRAADVPLAARFPAELSLAANLGPLRTLIFGGPAWLPAEESRQEGSFASLFDEFEAGLFVRLSRQHRYWGEVNAGGGLALGVRYWEFADTRALFGLIGFNLVGAQ